MKSLLHPLDPLKPHYNERTLDNGRVQLQCKYCVNKYTGQTLSAARHTFKSHLIPAHPNRFSEEYVMTQEDNDLDADFEIVGKPEGHQLHFRKYICFAFDSVAKRAIFVYCRLSKQLLNPPESKKEERQVSPRNDIFLPKVDQLSAHEFLGQKLPNGYQKGHIIGLGLARFSTFLHDVINCCSDVAFQHQQLKQGHWKYLEELVEGLLLNYEVRIMAGTAGHLEDKQTTSRAQVARWWWMVIVSSDNDNTNWRYSAFLFPNIACTENLAEYKVTIPQLQALLEFEIFPNIIADLRTEHESDINPTNFELWAMNKWFPPSTSTAESDDDDDDEEEPGPSKKKKKVVPLEYSDDDE